MSSRKRQNSEIKLSEQAVARVSSRLQREIESHLLQLGITPADDAFS